MNHISSGNDSKVVLVTGFGPFISNGVVKDINASGEAVKLIRRKELECTQNITLVTRQVPIEYKYVDQNIPKMWQAYQPDLIIHVGISDMTKGFTLETHARKAGYIQGDNCQKMPDGQMNSTRGPLVITTDLEVEIIAKEFNCGLSEDDLKADVSKEAGNYLCEYIYYTSLCQRLNDYKSTLFVHVPPMKTIKEFEELARGLERLVELCVAHIRTHDIEYILPIKVCDLSAT